MAYSGPFKYGDRVQLTDAKRRHFTLYLKEGNKFHSHQGIVEHDDIVGMDEGSVITSTMGGQFLMFRHLMVDHVLSMPRGAQVIYPKDAAQILIEGDIFRGAKVLEAGAGSGALSMALLRAVGPEGHVYSYELREDHIGYAIDNVKEYFGEQPQWWSPRLGDFQELTPEDTDGPVDRIVLDMLEPWEMLTTVKNMLVPGGVFITYVARASDTARTSYECAHRVFDHDQAACRRRRAATAQTQGATLTIRVLARLNVAIPSPVC